MQQRYAQTDQRDSAGHDAAAPLLSLSLSLADHSGRKRQGRAVLLRRWPAEPGGERLAEGEEFRVVILAEPPEGPVSPAEGIVVSAPAGPLGSAATTVREGAATYTAAKPSHLALSPGDIELLRRGQLFAATPLQVAAEEVFAGGKARLTLLARELITGRELAGYLNPIAIALNAPGAAGPASRERLEELKELVEAVGELGAGAAEAKAALERLSQLASAADTSRFLAGAERLYLNKQALMEDVYLLRAFRQTPEEASDLLALRRFLLRAVVPADEAELMLDRSLMMEQLTFAALAVEPQRLPPARAAFERFRQRYIAGYHQHHTSYWAEMARLHARLFDEQQRVYALRRLNSLAELGPPVGIGALAACDQLLAETAGCPLIGGVEDAAKADGVCPACGLGLDQDAPVQRIDEILSRIERACARQMARLSSGALQQVLRRSNDARVERFLKVIQASQLSSLIDVIDDELVGYLRRFLVESRIEEALQPILDHLQAGVTPKVDDAQSAMREVSQVLQRAFQAAQRALPPADPELTDSPPARRKRKR